MSANLKGRTVVLLAMAAAMAGCGATEPRQEAASQPFAGWYMERSGQGMFQPCGQSAQWRVVDPTQIRAKGKAAGLTLGDPVYARVTGWQTGDAIRISSVDQMGSATPVHDCQMTGLSIPG